MEDFSWDLHAVVSGCNGEGATGSMIDQQQEQFSGCLNDIELNELCFSFPDIFQTNSYLDELENLYKPFYPNTLSSQTSTSSSSMNVVGGDDVKELPEKLHPGGSSMATTSTSSPHSSKYKRSRKNQSKTVVQQVAVDGTPASDMWAWRKYGQKPIKGSIHPRSYYRCSSSKGCSARKQVERSHTDAGMFIITYTAEHNHTHPTRRNSLAGSTRNKFPKGNNTAGVTDSKDGCSPNSAGVLSPATPLPESSSGYEFVQTSCIKRDDNEMLIREIILRDELFPSLGEFDELNLPDQSWFINK